MPHHDRSCDRDFYFLSGFIYFGSFGGTMQIIACELSVTLSRDYGCRKFPGQAGIIYAARSINTFASTGA